MIQSQVRIKPITEGRSDNGSLVGYGVANYANRLKVWCDFGCYSQRCRHIYERDAVLVYLRNHQAETQLRRRNRPNLCKCAAAGESFDCF